MAMRLDSSTLVTLFGGSGFVGSQVVRALARTGVRMRVAVRRPELATHLQPLGGVGQIHAVQANVRDRDSVFRAARGAQGIVNLVAILSESGRQRFDAIQVHGARNIADAADEVSADALVHVSAIGVDRSSPSHYARAKAGGEAAAKAAYPDAVILRPSTIFGPGDSFLTRFASLARFAPALPLIGGGDTLFQPVYVGDVADAVLRALGGQADPDKIYELGGPEILTLRQVMERALAYSGRTPLLLNVPFGLARALGAVLQYLPGAPLTLDQVRLLEKNVVVSEAAKAEGRTLEGLGIEPTAMESIMPEALVRFRKRGAFTPYRG